MADTLHVELVRSKRGPSYIARFHGTVNRIEVKGELTHPIHYGIGEKATDKLIGDHLRVSRADAHLRSRDVPYGARRKVEQAVLAKFQEMEAQGPVENPIDYVRSEQFGFKRYDSPDGRVSIRQKKQRRRTKKVFGRGGKWKEEMKWNVFVDGKLVAEDIWTVKRAQEIVEEELGRKANPWDHEGGGCMVGDWAEGEELPCDDTFVNEETGERREFRSTVDGHLQGWHRGDEEITDEDLEDFEARVDVTRLKAKLLR